MAGENLVLFRADQQLTSDDLNNVESYTTQTLVDIFSDAVTPNQAYAGLAVAQSGPTSVVVGIGRYYSGGQAYANTQTQTFPLIAGLPVVAQKIATVCCWGVWQQTGVVPRAFVVNADTGQFQPQNVAMENSAVAQFSVVYGAESAAPTRGAIPSGVIAICDILLSPSGVVSITMDATYAISSLAALSLDIAAIESWESNVGSQINTLTTEIAILKALIPTNLAQTLAALAAQMMTMMNQISQLAASLAAIPKWSFCDRFINASDAYPAGAGYACVIEDGLRFPPGSGADVETGISLLNPLSALVITTNNITLPAYVPVARYTSCPIGSVDVISVRFGFSGFEIFEKSITIGPTLAYCMLGSFPVVSPTCTQRYHSRTSVRYGDKYASPCSGPSKTTAIANACASNVVANQSSTQGLAEIARRPSLTHLQCNRSGGEPYTLSWPNFWNKCDPTKLTSDRKNGCFKDKYEDPYWDAVTTTYSNSGSCLAHTFLNQNSGWLTHIKLFPRDIPSSGSLQISIIECDPTTLAPNHQKVVSTTSVPIGNVVGGALGTLIPLTPCFLSAGVHYGIMVSTPGNFSFYCIGTTEIASYGYIPGVLWYYDVTSVWIAAASQTPLFVQVFMAQFTSNQYQVQMQPASLSGGISAIRITSAGYTPAGTSLSWQAQVGGTWIPLDSTQITAFQTNPALVPIRAVFTGTSDVMPSLDLTQAEMELSLTATALDFWSLSRTLGANTTSIKLDLYIQQWDPAHHTYTAKVHVGGTATNPSSTVDTPDPQTPTTIKREFTFVVSSTASFQYELIATASAGNGFPLAQECWDFTY